MKLPNRQLPANYPVSPELTLFVSVIFLIIFLCCPVTGYADEKSKNDKSVELESVRSKIKNVKSGLDAAKTEADLLQEDLRHNEIAAGKESLKLKELIEQIKKRHDRLDELNLLISEHEKVLVHERSYLASQIRAAYISGRSDYIKLLLNQEDPAKVGRVLAYYDYYNRERIITIKSIDEKVSLINDLRASIQSETGLLEELKKRQIAKNEELKEYRESRAVILAKLEEDINTKGQQLNTLLEHERKLGALLNDLDKQEDRISFFEDVPPFDNLKGKLQWPIQGKLLNTFGSNRKGNSLKWQGVKIGADAGNEVRAVHTGKVIFADWFRNLGLLVIIDHGGGYMTLYGYNQNLLKKQGDWVLAGEPIALAGDSGGQSSPGVYFEIRYRGKPLNPVLWCKK